MKGIVMSGGFGTRLHPITKGVSKQLLPIYDKPMIYYPLSILMLAKIKDILIITTEQDISSYQSVLGDGEQFGINLSYSVQQQPNGLAEAFILGEKFIGNSEVCLVLGDNFFYGQGFSPRLVESSKLTNGAKVFAYQVKNPSDFAVVTFNKEMHALSIEEKPLEPKSNYAVTGLYFYDNKVIDIAKSILPSARGELEITSINNVYLESAELNVEMLGRGFAWLDTGTHDSLLAASHFVQTIEQRQGYKIACLEEIAYNNGWINLNELISRGEQLIQSGYGEYLLNLAKQK